MILINSMRKKDELVMDVGHRVNNINNPNTCVTKVLIVAKSFSVTDFFCQFIVIE